MFGIYNDTQPKENEAIQSESAPAFGGFESRWSYERYVSGQRQFSFPRRIIYACLGMFLALTGVLGGIAMFELVESNKTLYYPQGTLAEHFEAKPDQAALEMTAIADQKAPANPAAETVTAELSARYRIPVGVMIKHLDRTSPAYLSGIRPGDIIVSVSGVEITTVEILESLSGVLDHGGIPITVFRNNEYLELTYGTK